MASNGNHDDVYVEDIKMQLPKDFEERYQREVEEKMEQLKRRYQPKYEINADEIGDRYSKFAAEQLKTQQADIHVVNKVFQRVSRALGKEWLELFPFLMASFSKDDIKAKIETIERNNPNRIKIQAFKSLIMWKEEMGEKFNLDDLLNALNSCAMMEPLAEAEIVMVEGGDDLFEPIKGNSTTKSKIFMPTEASRNRSYANRMSHDPIEGEMDPETLRKYREMKDDPGAAACPLPPVPLEDRKLLQIAKKVGKEWPNLAQHLGVEEEDIEEIKASDNGPYEAAFKVLWNWKDSVLSLPQDNVMILKEALSKSGRQDLLEIL